MMKKYLLLGIVALLGAASSLMAAVKNGEQAPGFTLKTADGKEVSLSDYSGHWVILEWVNPGCPFVVKFYDVGAMQQFQEKAQSMGKDDTKVVWLSINSTTPSHGDYLSKEQTLQYISDKKVKSTWLMDESGDVGRAYGATNTPQMFLINPDGVILYQGAIDSIRSANSADIDKAENYIMGALKSALKGEEIATPRTRPYGCTVKY